MDLNVWISLKGGLKHQLGKLNVHFHVDTMRASDCKIIGPVNDISNMDLRGAVMNDRKRFEPCFPHDGFIFI